MLKEEFCRVCKTSLKYHRGKQFCEDCNRNRPNDVARTRYRIKLPPKEKRYCQICGKKLRPGGRLFCRKCYKTRRIENRRNTIREWGLRNKDKLDIKAKEWRKKNRLLIRERGRLKRMAVKEEIINIYGGKCICCGETEIKFLTIDHSNKDGREHRKSLTKKSQKPITMTGIAFYLKMKAAGFPKNIGLVVMCFNCHMAKDLYGSCPHQEKED